MDFHLLLLDSSNYPLPATKQRPHTCTPQTIHHGMLWPLGRTGPGPQTTVVNFRHCQPRSYSEPRNPWSRPRAEPAPAGRGLGLAR